MYLFRVLGPEAFLSIVYSMPGWPFTPPCCAFGLERIKLILSYTDICRLCGCFLNFYSFDPVPLILVFTDVFVKEFTPVSSLVFAPPQLLLENFITILRHCPF